MDEKELEKEQIAHLAKLSTLELSEKESESVAEYLENMRVFLSALQRVSCDDCESGSGKPVALLRTDEVKPSLSREKLLALSPKTDGKYYIVKRVVE